MSHIELRVGIEHHLTLLHFEQMDDEKYARIEAVLTEIQKKVKRGPTGTFEGIEMFGRFRNVRGINIHSPYVVALQAEIQRLCAERGILFSNDYGPFHPHVSKPLDSFVPGSPVPFADFISLSWSKGKKLTTFDLA